MALRLRRDVQKASYYVWFLGAEEARGLRGPRVINPVVPYLIERSRQQEPLKVTLQVSHKGIKILQGSSKHFIPHSAITSSIQIEDVVACVLLLYNPVTKCPLHVHGYRCDSETTAEALNQQLQVLTNRPENQKRFSELESKLGINSAPILSVVPEPKRVSRRLEASPKRFESSLGSDTGTSTRESECSEEHCVSSSISPMRKPKGDIFDSLAAELRAKLNGNGPPLLLPPRDYDTVHRSKGNLAAIELRRCRNSLIVGAKNNANKQIVSSRGSSGIGSDLAPSPERHDTHSSTDEENWSNEADNSLAREESLDTRKPVEISAKYRSSKEKIHQQLEKYRHEIASREHGQSCEKDGIGEKWSKEDEITPVLMRPSNFDARFKKVLMDKSYHDRKNGDFDHEDHHIKEQLPIQERKYRKHSDEKKSLPNFKYAPDSCKYSKDRLFSQSSKRQVYDNYDDEYNLEQDAIIQKENKTDKQKYQEAFIKKDNIDLKRYSSSPKYRDDEDMIHGGRREYHPSPERTHWIPINRYRHNNEQEYYFRESAERNFYRESQSSPYRDSHDTMKSPVLRYKSYDDAPCRPEYIDKEPLRRSDGRNFYIPKEKYNVNYLDRCDVSPKDRFNDAKQKFRAMEKVVSPYIYNEYNGHESCNHPGINGKYENFSDEEHFQKRDRRDEPPQNSRFNDRAREPSYRGITNSKSLSNLAKGYRHSYAEARSVIPRSGGRIGLAAVNPF